MTNIIAELGFRALYSLFLYIGFTALYYLTYGVQLEYFSAVFGAQYQSADFCFESFAWQWSRVDNDFIHAPDIRNQAQLNQAKVNSLTLLDGREAQPVYGGLIPIQHQSKSWSILQLASIIYFNPLGFQLDFVGLTVLRGYMFAWVCFQIIGFVLPGMLCNKRLKYLLALHLILVLAFVGPELGLYIYALIIELSVEPFDSELAGLSGG